MADENIESRLCAYIDGLLNEQEREEIEQYLDRYPEHRQLIDELIRQRSVLRDLPRDKAPGEVLAQFHNQLERSVLLGDLSEATSSRRSGRRRLNLAAIAAVILLAAGLSVVVWIAMPPKRGGQLVATAENSSQPAIEAIPGTVIPEIRPIIPATTPTPEPKTIPPALSVTMARSMAPAPANPPPRATLIDTGNPDRIILMIYSDDLSDARRKVQKFLESNSLATPATQPGSTQEIISSPNAIDAAIVVDTMTRDQAAELAREFSNTNTPATAPTITPPTTQLDITMSAAALSPAPATQNTVPATAKPTPRPQSEVTILFQKATPISAPDSASTEPTPSPTTEK